MGREKEEITSVLTDTLHQNPLVLFYQGDHERNPGYNILEIVEHNLLLYYNPKLIKRLVYLVIETVQNVERYSARVDTRMDFSMIYSDASSFRIVTQNLVRNDKKDGLQQRLKSIESKHKDELSSMYMEALAGNKRTEKGAGLGLIDLARKSKNNLTYEFGPYDDSYSTYRLTINYPISEAEPSKVDLAGRFWDLFRSNESTFFYRGDFSNQFLTVLLEMLNQIKGDTRISKSSSFQHTLIEVIQNIKKHGKKLNNEVPGFFCIEWSGSDVVIKSCNLIQPEKESELSERIEELNGSDKEKLDQINRAVLTDFSIDGGLGLIHSAMFSRPNLLAYNFDEILSFGKLFYLTVKFSNESTGV